MHETSKWFDVLGHAVKACELCTYAAAHKRPGASHARKATASLATNCGSRPSSVFLCDCPWKRVSKVCACSSCPTALESRTKFHQRLQGLLRCSFTGQHKQATKQGTHLAVCFLQPLQLKLSVRSHAAHAREYLSKRSCISSGLLDPCTLVMAASSLMACAEPQLG